MPAYLKIPVYLLVAVAAGGLAAPAVYAAGQAMAAAGVSDWLAGFPFHRVLSRCVQISALVLLWPALRWIGLRHLRDLGLRRNPSSVRDLTAGLLLSAGLVFLLALLYAACGFYVPRPDPEWSKLGRIILTAAAVGGVEEFVFRGVVLGICLWSLRPGAAVLLSSMFFAVVHFLRPARGSLGPGEVQWWSGWSELGSFVAAWPSADILAAGLVSLVGAGLILGFAAVRTRSLWLPIGLHAGWVLARQTSAVFLRPASEDASALLPWVGPDLVSGAVPTGLLPLAALGLTGWLVHLYLHHVFRPVDTRLG
jgi:membrane protease YdiL (CAAX protease family)